MKPQESTGDTISNLPVVSEYQLSYSKTHCNFIQGETRGRRGRSIEEVEEKIGQAILPKTPRQTKKMISSAVWPNNEDITEII